MPALQPRLEEVFKNRRGLVHSGPALFRVAERKRKPFASHGGLSAGPRSMWRHERGIGHNDLPCTAGRNQVVAVGAIAVEEDHKLTRASRARLKARSVEFS